MQASFKKLKTSLHFQWFCDHPDIFDIIDNTFFCETFIGICDYILFFSRSSDIPFRGFSYSMILLVFNFSVLSSFLPFKRSSQVA